VRRIWVAIVRVCSAWWLGSAAHPADAAELGLPIVAPDSQSSFESAPEAQLHAKDERWLSRPFQIGLSAIVVFPQATDPFFMPGAEFGYALPYVSLGGTFGYLDGINGSLGARGRLHLGHAVALTLGASVALLPLDETCWFDFGQAPEGCEEKRHWEHAFFAGGEWGVEGRSEAGFVWRVQAGYWGLLAHGPGTCRASDAALGCPAANPQPGVVLTQELSLGWAF
jgi:hypothetical protein